MNLSGSSRLHPGRTRLPEKSGDRTSADPDRGLATLEALEGKAFSVRILPSATPLFNMSSEGSF